MPMVKNLFLYMQEEQQFVSFCKRKLFNEKSIISRKQLSFKGQKIMKWSLCMIVNWISSVNKCTLFCYIVANLHGEKGSPSVIFEDIFIRKFLEGTFPTMYHDTTPIVIRRRQNLIDISIWMRENPITKGIVEKGIPRLHFLHGYSEELLSRFLKCPVKLDIHCVDFEKVEKETRF